MLPVLVVWLATSGLILAADSAIRGQVIDDNNTPVANARITLTPSSEGSETTSRIQAESDPTGRFAVSAPEAAGYSIQVECEGHFLIRQQIMGGQSAADLVVTLPRQIRSAQSMDVVYSGAGVDLDRTHTQTLVTGTELLDVPYPQTNDLRNAVRILPGVVKDSRGGIHVNGGNENQVQYTLDGFTINDPLSGTLEARLSVEAVQAFELKSGSMPAEYGKGAAGTLSIRTEPGTDKRRLTATNFVPGFEKQKTWMTGGWTPRFGFSGPLVKGRAWLSNSTDIQFINTVIREAEAGKDHATSWRGGNMLRLQVNLTPSNIVSAGFLTNYLNARNTGLTALDPIETTSNRRGRSHLFYLRDQIAFHGGGLAEVGYAGFRSFAREIPHGHSPQIYTPYGRRGNYLMDAKRTASRDQFLFNMFLPAFNKGGRHQIKAGFDGQLLSYEQDLHRNGFEFRRADYSLIQETRFAGSGAFRKPATEISAYVQDTWKPTAALVLELGLRHEWDSLVSRPTLAPRIGIARALGERTKLAAGYAAVYETGNLRIFGEALDQYSVSTFFDPSPAGQRFVRMTRYRVDPTVLRSPKYGTWNASIEHDFQARMYARASYLRRRGSRGFAFLPVREPEPQVELQAETAVAAITQQLTNLRTDVYDSFEVVVRHSFSKQYEWMAGYTRSRALSNAVTDVRIDNPTIALNNAGRMPWDSPNRIVSWGYLPTWSKVWAVAYMLEYRTGQPFSIQHEDGSVIGAVNSHRYPDFLELNTHVERRFSALGYNWAFRFGFNNVTNHQNPNVVMNTVGVPDFLRFYGGQRRAFNVRMRWLGKTMQGD